MTLTTVVTIEAHRDRTRSHQLHPIHIFLLMLMHRQQTMQQLNVLLEITYGVFFHRRRRRRRHHHRQFHQNGGF
jgi:hypothetical protein